MNDLSELLVELVSVGAEVVMSYREQLLAGGDVGLMSKTATRGDLVTDADLASEQAMLDLLSQRRPDDGVISEEHGFRPGTSDLTWVLDPLDGTANFARRSENFGVIAGLVRGSRSIAGAMCLPTIDVMYAAVEGSGATRNGEAITRAASQQLANATLDHSLLHFADAERRREQSDTLHALLGAARGMRCDHSLRYLADTIDGVLDGFVYHSLGLWDIAGSSAILREVGVTVSDLAGQPLDLAAGRWSPGRLYPTIGATPALHAEIVAAIKS